jgi:hypothetical protein
LLWRSVSVVLDSPQPLIALDDDAFERVICGGGGGECLEHFVVPLLAEVLGCDYRLDLDLVQTVIQFGQLIGRIQRNLQLSVVDTIFHWFD